MSTHFCGDAFKKRLIAAVQEAFSNVDAGKNELNKITIQ
jgi:hypothetical protein